MLLNMRVGSLACMRRRRVLNRVSLFILMSSSKDLRRALNVARLVVCERNLMTSAVTLGSFMAWMCRSTSSFKLAWGCSTCRWSSRMSLSWTLLELIPPPCPTFPRLLKGNSTPNSLLTTFFIASPTTFPISGSLIYSLTSRNSLHTQTYVPCCAKESHPLPHWPPHHQRNSKKSTPPSKLLPRQ